MRTSTTPTEADVGPAKNSALQHKPEGEPSNPYLDEIAALKSALQEQRRATTLLNGEVQRQIEAREAVEAQLIEANAEIVTSWERRKEITRVISDRDAKIASAKSEIEASRARQQEMARELDTARAREQEMVRELTELRAEIKATRERRKEIARVVSNRDEKIAKLKAELQARYEELAALQRHIARSSPSGRAKRLVRPITRLFR